MLNRQAIKTLQIKGNPPPQLKDCTFYSDLPLWQKDQHHFVCNNNSPSNKYEYFKIGRTLGLQTTRYISVMDSHLLYYNEACSTEHVGYCSLQNVYVEWFELKNQIFLFLVSNGKDTSLFYFKSRQFWIEQRQRIAKHAVQLDFQHQYQVMEQIGEGSFSKVYKVKNSQNGKIFAAKVMTKRDKQQVCNQKLVMEEKKLLQLMGDSECSSMIFEFFQTEEKYIFLLEYLEGNDLMSLLSAARLKDVCQKKHMIADILLVLKECHQRQIIHRDIKPQNIIVGPNMKPKLIDFGLSIHNPHSIENSCFKRCGTMGYMAPEVISNVNQSKKSYTYKCDLFSMGIVAHLILMGVNPLKGRSYEQTRIINEQCNIKLNREKIVYEYGESCLLFLQKLLETNPKLRYSAQQALHSQFLRDSSDKQSTASTTEQKRKPSFDD